MSAKGAAVHAPPIWEALTPDLLAMTRYEVSFGIGVLSALLRQRTGLPSVIQALEACLTVARENG